MLDTNIITLTIIMIGSYLVGLVSTLLIVKRYTKEKEIDYYERALLDIIVRLKILELRVKDEHISQEISHNITYHKKEGVKDSIDSIELKVLNLLREGAKTSREIEASIGRSREHTARLMKALYDKGYVRRDESMRPYRYTLTDDGSKTLTQLGNA